MITRVFTIMLYTAWHIINYMHITTIHSGLFVPSLLSGAAFGRLCGHLLHKMDFSTDFSNISETTGATAKATFADSGTYALIGM
jgi:H+/Cl- antiporter ClcA